MKKLLKIILIIITLVPINTKALDKINVLYYKYIDNCTYDTCIDKNLFLLQLNYLHSQGFKTITLEELEKWKNNEIELDEKSILLVIENNNANLNEILKTYNYKINELADYKLFFKNEKRAMTLNDSLNHIPVHLMKNMNIFEFNNILNYKSKEENYDYSKLATKIPVFNYHFIYIDEPVCNEDICLNLKHFEDHLTYLKANNYKILTMDEFIKWKNKEIELPFKSVLLTFDDGGFGTGKNNGNYLIPTLEKYDAYATLYLTTSFWDINNYISPNLEIQTHTHDLHNLINQEFQMSLTSYEDIKNDLKTSLDIVKDNSSFAFPFYYYNQDGINALKDLDFKVAFVGGNKKATRNSNNYLIPRYVVLNTTDLEEFKSMLEN